MVERHKLQRFIGPWVLGTLAWLSEDSATCRQALERGQALLDEGCVRHNDYRFHVSAAETWLLRGEVAPALRHAQALRDIHPDETCAWVEHHAGLAEDCASWMSAPDADGRARLAEHRRQGERFGFAMTMPGLHRRLQNL
jgi:hypothetical protein